ncbi:mechanosensitive ion channel domain-containing protein [Lachnospiraceae bacterium 56-18]|jgi:small conductance mechanosensitive channel|uniref:mechanosensitive ion channel family protein n=1 Tax=Sporofaciens sp. JLR.KK001 TaxID=3112621 RepID=UPI002FF04EBA
MVIPMPSEAGGGITTAGDVAVTAAVEVKEVTQDTVEEVGRLAQFIQDSIPKLAGFGVRILIALAVFFVGRIVIRWIQKLVRRSLERSSADKGVEQFVDSFLKVGLYSLLIFSIAAKFGVDTASVAALVASGGVAIGLALQGSLSNFAGGVLILLLKPFEVGDYISEDTNKNEGTVKEIQIFYTKLSTIDNKTIVIPNGMLTNSSLTNATAKDERRLDLKVSISYQADLRKAKALIEEILRSDECVMKDEEINVFVDELAESAVILGARAWVKNEEFWPTRWRMLETIKLTLDEHGIEIPYPQLTVHMHE